MSANTASKVWGEVYERATARRADLERLGDYYDGIHSIPINVVAVQSRLGNLFSEFADNICRPVIEAAEPRLRIIEFGDGQGLGVDAQRVWKRSRMLRQHRFVHTDAMVYGDAYAIVWPFTENGAQRARIFPQVTPSMTVLYDEVDPERKVVAAKWWVMREWETPTVYKDWVRVNLYWPNRLERYVSRSSTNQLDQDFARFEPYTSEGSAVTAHGIGEVPVYQFSANYDMHRGFGRSDIEDVLPLQDAVNKILIDALTASEYTAAPQRWATGVEIPLDPKTGEPIQTYTHGADRLWTAPDAGASFGQFQQGSLEVYRTGIEMLLDHIAFVSRTPQYALFRMSNFPSGDALRVIEGPLRNRVLDHQTDFGSAWTDLMRAALKIEGVEVSEDELDQIEPRWLPANTPFHTTESMEELKVKAETLGVPEEQLWQEAGYSRAQIDEMLAMRENQVILAQGAAELAAAQTLNAFAPTPEQQAIAADTGLAGEGAPPQGS